MATDRTTVPHPIAALALTVVALVAAACGGSPTEPTRTALTITGTTPASGTSVTIPQKFPYIVPGGVAILPGSGVLSVRVSMSSAVSAPWAQLSVYLLTGGTTDQYCGQNTPDAPTWQFITPGWTANFEVTGFRVYRLPCDVSGVRAMLHMRNNGLLTPPNASETIAEATVSTSLHLQQ